MQDLRRSGGNDAHPGYLLLLFFVRPSQKQVFVRLELEVQVCDVHAEKQERGAARDDE